MKQNTFIRYGLNAFGRKLKYFNHNIHCPIHALRFELFCDNNVHETKCALEYVIEDNDCLTIVPFILATARDKTTHKIYTTNAEWSKLIQEKLNEVIHPQLFDKEVIEKAMQMF